MKNLLILSPGRRVEIVQYFKDAFHKENRKVYTLDMSDKAPALYFGDEYFRIDKDFAHLDLYINKVLEICKKKEVGAIITLIDPELVLLSHYKQEFDQLGVKLILSNLDFVESTFDKFEFYNKYKGILKLVETVGSAEDALNKLNSKEWEFPLFAKLRDGSASIGIKKINSFEDIEELKSEPKYIYQPFIAGKEYGVDTFFDLKSGKLVSMFIKEKLTMRAGETDKAISVHSQNVIDEVLKVQNIKGLYGPIDIDVFVSNDGEVYINEINPRFGGGYPHAYGCGVNFMNLILNNLNGNENQVSLDSYKEGIMMLKYNGLYFKDTND